ncbi:MAG: aldo/keto reductase, partial [Planctomycetes bacterium]|nr:aldo/keto reductase [Planctomycetota bacterium]
LSRLRIPRITLLQLHNSITPNRNDEPTSITPDDVLGPRSVVAAMDDLRSAGLIDQFGLTGIGDPESLRTVIRSERFATIQAPFHLLNPTTLYEAPSSWPETNYRRFLEDAHELQMGIFAIRVFAAGALLDAPPSSHTLTTPFFPLDLYERDRCTARKLKQNFDASSMAELSLRYVLSHDQITASIIGFGNPSQVEQAVEFTNCGPLPNARLRQLNEFVLNSNCE